MMGIAIATIRLMSIPEHEEAPKHRNDDKRQYDEGERQQHAQSRAGLTLSMVPPKYA